jgi:hypothetical protein
MIPSPRGSVSQSKLRVITFLFEYYITLDLSPNSLAFPSFLPLIINSPGTSPPVTISYHPTNHSLSPLNLPSTINSISGLEFIGFDHKTATHIYKSYDRYKEPFSSTEATNYDFFSFIHGHIIHINSSKFDGLEDVEKMTKLGIRKEIIAAILDERFWDMFGTQGLGYWIEETVKVNYATLLRLEREKDQKEELGFEDVFEHCEVVDHPPKVLDNHTILYKAIAATSSLDFEPLFLDNGTLNISSLSSPRRGDFNGQNSTVYLTPSKSLALHYLDYTTLRCPFSTTFLICLTIPNQLLFFLSTNEVRFSETWKEYLWYSETKTPLPEHLQRLGKADVVKGFICTKPPARLARLSLQDLQSEVTEDDILMLEDGLEAVQWCFREKRVREVLGCGGKVHVEIFGPSLRARD